MSAELAGLLGTIILLVLVMLRVPVALALMLVGFGGFSYLTDGQVGLAELGMSPFGTASSYNLSVMPLFIFMGMILTHSGLGKELYKTVDTWLGHLRGGLAMATIGASAVFSAISGSVTATTATIASIALPEMKKYDYKSSLATGCVAAGGTLGILIPPSVILILYGVLTMEPIGGLLIASIIPGILQTVLFMSTVYLQIRKDPTLAPMKAPTTSMEKLRSMEKVWPVIVIFGLSIGGLYFGLFTPSEAGGVGAFGAFIFAVISKRLTGKGLLAALDETVRLNAMIFLILIGATLFGKFLAVSKIPMLATSLVGGLNVSPYIILIAILAVYFILGLFMEGIAILVLTVPIVYPLIIELGFNGMWFGVIMVLMLNMGLLTPPLGMNVFITSSTAKDVPIETIFKGVIPFLISIVICTALLIIFPQLATFLPSLMD